MLLEITSFESQITKYKYKIKKLHFLGILYTLIYNLFVLYWVT